MGFGGNLIWTGVFHAIKDQAGTLGTACDTPMFSDWMFGYRYRRDRSYRDDTVFRGNPDILHVSPKPKAMLWAWVDRVFEKLISPNRLRKAWERWMFSAAMRNWHAGNGPLLVHIDMRIHSYSSEQNRYRTIWKTGGCAAHVIAKPFGVQLKQSSCFFYPTTEERDAVALILRNAGVRGKYVVVEPDTNRDWFGDLRAWPMDRWQKFVDAMNESFPNIPILQTGLGRGGILNGVVDITGKTTFREAGSLLENAGLYVGTEGGLMHLAAAVRTPSVILWGGITLPEFAGYPHLHRIICHYVECAPCGQSGWCENRHQCMKKITVEEVQQAAIELLEKNSAN